MKAPSKVKELWTSLFAEDKATRQMARLFWASCLLALTTAIIGGSAIKKRWAADAPSLEDTQTADNLSRLVSRQKQSAKAHASTLGLGRFHFELRGKGGNAPVSNSAEIEIFIECDKKSSCDQIEGNPTVLRDQISVAVGSQDRDVLLTPEGKLLLKRTIQRKLNSLVRDGVVRQVYFSDFVLN